MRGVPGVSLSQHLQAAPPAGVHERDQQHRPGVVDAGGGGGEAPAGVHAPLLQSQSFLLPGEILQHPGMMERRVLQREPDTEQRRLYSRSVSECEVRAPE